MEKRSIAPFLKAAAGVLLLGLLLLFSKSFDLGSYYSLDRIRETIHSLGPYGPLMFVFLCIAAVLLHIPEILLIAAGSVVFGGVLGFALGWTGSMIGLTISFTMARYFLKESFRDIVTIRSRRLMLLDEKLERHGFVTVLCLRLVLFMVPPLNWALGVTRVRLVDYLGGSALGIAPCAAIVCYAGHSMAKATSLVAILSPEILLPLGVAAAMIVLCTLAARRFFL